MAAYLLALRLGRWGIAGFGAVAFLVTLLQAAGFYKIAGRTEAERQAFGRSISVLASQFTVIIAPPIRPDTVGGYVQWRAFGFLAILFAIWGLASASGAARGDEDRGLVGAILAGGLSRPRMITARFAAFATGALVAALAASAGMLVGVASGGETISTVAALQAALVLAALGVCCYSLTLLFAQFTSARNSTAIAGVILLALFLVNSLSRTFDALVSWRWLSPFHYYEQSSPLTPGGTLDVRAALVLLGIAAAAAALAAFAFRYRDVGSPLISLPTPSRRPSYQMSRSPVWRIPVLRDLYERRVSLLVWTVGLSALGALFVVLTKSIVKPLLAIPELAPYFALFVNGNIYASFFGYIWFGFAQLLMAGFAITQVARWSAGDSDGRPGLTPGAHPQQSGIPGSRRHRAPHRAHVWSADHRCGERRGRRDRSPLPVDPAKQPAPCRGLIAAGAIHACVRYGRRPARIEDPSRDGRHTRGFRVRELPHRRARTHLQAAGLGAGCVSVQALRPTAHCRNGPNWSRDHARDRDRRADGFRARDGTAGHWRLRHR